MPIEKIIKRVEVESKEKEDNIKSRVNRDGKERKWEGKVSTIPQMISSELSLTVENTISSRLIISLISPTRAWHPTVPTQLGQFIR